MSCTIVIGVLLCCGLWTGTGEVLYEQVLDYKMKAYSIGMEQKNATVLLGTSRELKQQHAGGELGLESQPDLGSEMEPPLTGSDSLAQEEAQIEHKRIGQSLSSRTEPMQQAAQSNSGLTFMYLLCSLIFAGAGFSLMKINRRK
ncbi:hypothetical protein D3C74_112500 [compost metagenome]